MFIFYYRKIVQYIHGCDSGIDEVDGHGTHASSIAVGSIAGGDLFDGSIAEYSGVAPGAQLAMFDLGTASNLCIPGIKEMLWGAQQAGAKVFSNSWGSGPVSNYQTADIDLYLFLNQVWYGCVLLNDCEYCRTD
jgi:subtilisin family serine protease